MNPNPKPRAHPLSSRSRSAIATAALAAIAGWPVSSPAEQTVQTVVVTASRHRMLAVDAPASVSVVTRSDIEARGADNVLEAVRLESGLSLQGRAVGGRQVLGQRGLDARHTLLLLDGLRTTASDGVVGASDFQYDGLSSLAIERIEVVRGPLSVLYGSEALGGVINVITRQPGDRWRVDALVEGSWADGQRGGDGWRAGAGADGPLGGGFAVRAGIATRSLQPLALPADARLSELEGRDKRDGWLGLVWRGEDQQLRLEHREGEETRESGARERGGARRYHLSFNDIDRQTDSLVWEADRFVWPGAAEPLQTQLRAYRTRLAVSNRRTAGVSTNPAQVLTDEVVDGQVRGAFGAHALLVGFEARTEALADPGLPDGRSDVGHHALFLQDEWTANRQVTVTTGIRHDRHGQFGDQWSPRVYAVWRATEGWTAKGGYSHGFKAPNLKQTVPGPRAEGPNIVIGNPDLEPEVADSIEAGLGFANPERQVQAVAFAQRVRDLIELRLVTPGATPGTGTYVYANLARARLQGLELNWAERLTRWLSLRTAVSALNARDGNGQRLERRPRVTGSVRLDAQHGPWRLGWSGEYVGEQWLPSPTVGAPARPVSGFTLQGAHLTRSMPGGWDLTLGVRNLGNVRLGDRSPLFTQVEPPRTWRLALLGHW